MITLRLFSIEKHIHYNPFITRFRYNTVLDRTQFKDGSKKCIDYIDYIEK